MRKLAICVTIVVALVITSGVFAQHIGPYIPFVEQNKVSQVLSPEMESFASETVLGPQWQSKRDNINADYGHVFTYTPEIFTDDGVGKYAGSNDQEYSIVISGLLIVDPRTYGDSGIFYSLSDETARPFTQNRDRDYWSEVIIPKGVALIGVELSMVSGDYSKGCHSPKNSNILIRVDDSGFFTPTGDSDLDIPYFEYGEFKPIVDFSPDCNSSGWFFFLTPKWSEGTTPDIEVFLYDDHNQYLWNLN